MAPAAPPPGARRERTFYTSSDYGFSVLYTDTRRVRYSVHEHEDEHASAVSNHNIIMLCKCMGYSNGVDVGVGATRDTPWLLRGRGDDHATRRSRHDEPNLPLALQGEAGGASPMDGAAP